MPPAASGRERAGAGRAGRPVAAATTCCAPGHPLASASAAAARKKLSNTAVFISGRLRRRGDGGGRGAAWREWYCCVAYHGFQSWAGVSAGGTATKAAPRETAAPPHPPPHSPHPPRPAAAVPPPRPPTPHPSACQTGRQWIRKIRSSPFLGPIHTPEPAKSSPTGGWGGGGVGTRHAAPRARPHPLTATPETAILSPRRQPAGLPPKRRQCRPSAAGAHPRRGPHARRRRATAT